MLAKIEDLSYVWFGEGLLSKVVIQLLTIETHVIQPIYTTYMRLITSRHIYARAAGKNLTIEMAIVVKGVIKYGFFLTKHLCTKWQIMSSRLSLKHS